MKFDRPTRKKRHRDAPFELPHDLVPHPRARQMASTSHGRRPPLTDDAMRAMGWQFRRGTVVPGTALLANTALQCFCCYPRKVYADVLKQCRTCVRPFLFYANEQRFWFETLRLPVDVDCVNCPPCRKHARRVKAAQARYASALNAPRLDAKDLKVFVDDTLLLFEAGQIRNVARVGAIKNRARRELPGCSATQALEHALAVARAAAAMGPFLPRR